MKIGELARRAEVGIDTVRYYERAGVLPRPRRQASGYRDYGPADVARLQFIRRAKALGFSLDEIRELLQLSSAGNGGRAQVRTLAARRLRDVETRLAELEAMRRVLADLVRRCSGTGSVAGCPIIEAVVGTDDTASLSNSLSKDPP
jgi:Hg(II)-responsive transcriptional regulator